MIQPIKNKEQVMVTVRFRFKGKSAIKKYDGDKKFDNLNLGDMKPTSAIIYGGEITENQLKKLVTKVTKALECGVPEIQESVIIKDKDETGTEG